MNLLEDRVVPAYSPTGFLDWAGPDGVSQFTVGGWAYDPDSPGTRIQVHIYIDGQFAFATTANHYRPDLGQYWGYSAAIPSQYLTGGSHTVVAYGIDVWGGDPNAQLNGIKTFANQPTQGFVDSIDNSGVVHGWGLDPNFPSQETRIDLYVDGNFASSVMTTEHRSDINGGVGNHGYSIALPSSITAPTPMSGQPHHTITTDCVNIANPLAGNLNTPLGTKSYTWGDSTTTNGTVTVHTAGSLAGAIDSLKWNGAEFINSYDHGRELQNAVFGVTANHPNTPLTAYNPTEAGRWDDGVAANPSTSELTGISSPNSAELRTTTRMANWYTTAEGGDLNGLSQVLVSKDVGLSYNGVSSIIWNRSTFTVPQEDGGLTQIQFQPPIIFTNGNTLTSNGYYDPNTGAIVGLANNVPSPNNWPVVQQGNYGAYAIVIVTVQVTGTMIPSIGNTGAVAQGGPGEPPYGYMGDTFRGTAPAGTTYSGTFKFESIICIGSASTVTSDLAYLHSLGKF